MKLSKNPLAIALGATFALGGAAAQASVFQAADLPDGYMVVAGDAKTGEHKCGEGKCGEKMKEKAADAKSGDASGEKKDAKAGEMKCGEGKCGEKKPQ
jgi:uncharacterized low-complexity protein